MITVKAMVAMDEGRVIGKDGDIPWHLPEDLKRLSKFTTGHSVLMGRKTYFSLPEKFRPLPSRENIIVTRNPESLAGEEGIVVCADPVEFIEACKAGTQKTASQELWILGGSEIYRSTIDLWDELYLTVVSGKHEGDTFFPEFESVFSLTSEEPREGFVYKHYTRSEPLSALSSAG